LKIEYVKAEKNLKKKISSKFTIAINIFYILILLATLAVKLVWAWLMLYWRSWRTRRIFERELIKYGMPEKSARKLSAQISAFKKKLIKRILKLGSKPPKIQDPT